MFAFENLQSAGAGTMVRDVTAGIAFHTEMRSVLQEGVWRFVVSEEERRLIHSRELKKFHYLRNRFIRDLIDGKRIYVAKRNDGLTDNDAAALFDAIASWGTGRLLFLTLANDDHASGEIERVNDRVVHGWIDRFAPFSAANETSSSAWTSVLHQASQIFEANPRGARRSRLSDRSPQKSEVSPGESDDELPRIGKDNGSLVPAAASLAAHDEMARQTPIVTFPPTSGAFQTPPHNVHQAASRTRWVRTGEYRSRPAPRASKAETRHFDIEDLAHGRDSLLQRPMAPQSDAVTHVPERFLQDEYFNEAYPIVAARSARPARVAKPRYTPAGYFSARALAIARRMRSVETYPHRIASYPPEHVEQLRQMFSPRLYARLVELPADNSDRLWDHYLRYGLPAGIAPTPLFDADLYGRQASLAGLPAQQFGEPMALHWLRVGCSAGIVPTSMFDAAFYLAQNKDVPGTELDAYRHYLSHGLYEGRAPNIWFDPHWYSDRTPSPDVERYDHFIAIGVHDGRTPSFLVNEIIRIFGHDERFDSNIYATLIDASVSWHGVVTTDALRLFWHLYSPYWQNSPETPLREFLTYLREGIAEDRKPGPLFDAALYRRRVIGAGLPPLAEDDSALLHWLRFGYAARIVPTERFDEAFYRAKNPDIDWTDLWGFSHFLGHGLYEGRVATQKPMFRHREPLPKAMAAPMPTLCRHWYAMDFPDAETGWGHEIPRATYDRLYEFLDSDLLASIFIDAQAIEPEVGELAAIGDWLLLPYYDAMALRDLEARRRLPKTSYDTVICVPWIRVGGADLVAGLLAKAMLQIRPEENLLVLRVDQPHFERANWLPGGADVVDISDLVAGISLEHQENLLRGLFRGVAPRRVINVNSRLCWSVFRTYGANLASTMNLYAYMFCWDQTPTGLRVGYPAEFYAATADNVTAFLTDTNYLRAELAAMYRLPTAMSDRIRPVFTPAQSPVWVPSAARTMCEQAEPGSRHLVLWAGRLDRQKRFDLVQEIARLMPDVEFRCWGAALLDSPPDLSALPENVKMQGAFESFDELPLRQAGAWLFTALWEGMPTTIIELAVRGVAIVASAVGGVPELIEHETGWPIPGNASAALYVASLREALSNPEEATRRAETLQRRAAEIYSQAAYNAALAQLFKNESGALA